MEWIEQHQLLSIYQGSAPVAAWDTTKHQAKCSPQKTTAEVVETKTPRNSLDYHQKLKNPPTVRDVELALLLQQQQQCSTKYKASGHMRSTISSVLFCIFSCATPEMTPPPLLLPRAFTTSAQQHEVLRYHVRPKPSMKHQAFPN